MLKERNCAQKKIEFTEFFGNLGLRNFQSGFRKFSRNFKLEPEPYPLPLLRTPPLQIKKNSKNCYILLYIVRIKQDLSCPVHRLNNLVSIIVKKKINIINVQKVHFTKNKDIHMYIEG